MFYFDDDDSKITASDVEQLAVMIEIFWSCHRVSYDGPPTGRLSFNYGGSSDAGFTDKAIFDAYKGGPSLRLKEGKLAHRWVAEALWGWAERFAIENACSVSAPMVDQNNRSSKRL